MGITREQFAVLAKGMKAAYPQNNFLPDQESFNVWYALLSDLDYPVLSKAIQKHMMTVKFPPTIADIRETATELTSKVPELTDAQAWALVQKALCNSSYNSKSEFAKLPEAVQQAVGSPEQLKIWALTENLNHAVVSSNVQRAYRSVIENMKKREVVKVALECQQQMVLE